MALITTKQVRTVDFLRLLSVLTKPKLQTMLQLPVDKWEEAGVYLGWESKIFIESDLQRPQLVQSQLQLTSDYYSGTAYYIRDNSYSGHPSESEEVTIKASDYNPTSNVVRQCLYPNSTYINLEFYDDGGISIKTSENNPLYFNWCYILEDGTTRFGAPFTTIDNFKWVSSSGVSYSLSNVLNIWTRYNTNTSFKVNFNTKVFYNEAGARDYINTGSTDGELVPITDEVLDRTTVLYMRATEYKSEFSIRKPSSQLGKPKEIKFYVKAKISTGEKIKFTERAVFGFVFRDKQAQHINIWNDLANVTSGNAFSSNNPDSSTSNGYRAIYNIIHPVTVDTLTVECTDSTLPQVDLYWYDDNGYMGSHSGYKGVGSTISVPTGATGFKIEFKRSDGARNPVAVMSGLTLAYNSQSTATDYKNLAFVKNPAFDVYKIELNGEDVTNSFDWTQRWTVWKNNNLFEGYYYWADIVTNMYVFDSYESAYNAIQNGVIDNLLSNTTISDTEETPLTDNEIDYDGGMSETFLLTKNAMNELADRLSIEVTTDGNILRNMFIGLSMHNNPVDVVIDLFALPIDVDDFVETEDSKIDFNPRTRTTDSSDEESTDQPNDN